MIIWWQRLWLLCTAAANFITRWYCFSRSIKFSVNSNTSSRGSKLKRASSAPPPSTAPAVA
jgi:hypothetical protein